VWSRLWGKLNERRYRQYTLRLQSHSNGDGQQMLMLTKMSVLGKKKLPFLKSTAYRLFTAYNRPSIRKSILNAGYHISPYKSICHGLFEMIAPVRRERTYKQGLIFRLSEAALRPVNSTTPRSRTCRSSW